MTLTKDIETYERELPNLLNDDGKFVLIEGDAVAGVYDTYEDALKAGYEKLGLNPFLVKQIQTAEQVQSFTRAVEPCRT